MKRVVNITTQRGKGWFLESASHVKRVLFERWFSIMGTRGTSEWPPPLPPRARKTSNPSSTERRPIPVQLKNNHYSHPDNLFHKTWPITVHKKSIYSLCAFLMHSFTCTVRLKLHLLGSFYTGFWSIMCSLLQLQIHTSVLCTSTVPLCRLTPPVHVLLFGRKATCIPKDVKLNAVGERKAWCGFNRFAAGRVGKRAQFSTFWEFWPISRL